METFLATQKSWDQCAFWGELTVQHVFWRAASCFLSHPSPYAPATHWVTLMSLQYTLWSCASSFLHPLLLVMPSPLLTSGRLAKFISFFEMQFKCPHYQDDFFGHININKSLSLLPSGYLLSIVLYLISQFCVDVFF